MGKILNGNVFLPFLLENGHNTINLVNNDLDCNDCGNVWIREHEELQSRISPLKSLDGKDINNFRNFKNC